jgi:hypothetical protein
VTASVRVRNTCARAGEEIVQIYPHDVTVCATRPVKQLAGFNRGTADQANSRRESR